MAVEINIMEERCKGCNICIEVCQADVLDIAEETDPNRYTPPCVKNANNCNFCGLCEMFCPDYAIQVSIKEE